MLTSNIFTYTIIFSELQTHIYKVKYQTKVYAHIDRKYVYIYVRTLDI